MKLFLKNIGKIAEACIEINGITVIAGENNTGKSTVGKALFAVFNSFHNIYEQISYERVENIANQMDMLYRSLTNRLNRQLNVTEAAERILSCRDEFKGSQKAVRDAVVKIISQQDEDFKKYETDGRMDGYISQIALALEVSDNEIIKSVLGRRMDAEFNGQINNVFTEETGEIELSIQDRTMKVSVKDNNIRAFSGEMDLHTETVYLDDPFIMDDINRIHYLEGTVYWDHRWGLRKKLNESHAGNLVEKIVAGNKLEKIYQRISVACNGDIVRDKSGRMGYRQNGMDKILDVRNLSSGFKTFAILKTLLQNGVIEYNGTIILDEPEIHLHPEWQLLFSEIIVLIQKEFGAHILLNTHSPYFLDAIEVYAAKYGIEKKCKYYLANSQGEMAEIRDVTGNIEQIYSKLARPLQELENERGRL